MTESTVMSDAERLLAAGADDEMIILFFRERGLNKIASIKAIRALFNKSTTDAKLLVDNSQAWSDRFYGDQDLHDKARRALLELASSGDESLPRIELVGFEETDR